MANRLWHDAKGASGACYQCPVRGPRPGALIGVIPHFTSVRGSQFEVAVPTRFLAEGVFLVQGIQAVPPRYFLRRLGVLTAEQINRVEDCLLFWLGVSRK